MTDTAIGLRGRLGWTQSMYDLSVIEQPCGIKITRIVRGHQVGVDEYRWHDVRVLLIGRPIPEGIQYFNITSRISTQFVRGNKSRDISTIFLRTHVECHGLWLEIARQLLHCDFAPPLGAVCRYVGVLPPIGSHGSKTSGGEFGTQSHWIICHPFFEESCGVEQSAAAFPHAICD